MYKLESQRGKHNKFFIIPTVAIYDSQNEPGVKVIAFIWLGYYYSIGVKNV